MTLLDLVRLLGRHWKLCVILPVVCALACAGVLFTRAQEVSYSTSSYIVTSSTGQLSIFNGAAQSAARACTADETDCIASAKAESSSLTVTISVSGSDSASVIDAANEIADTAVENARESIDPEKFSASVQYATASKAKAGSPRATFIVAAFLAGLLLAIIIVIVIDAMRRPVKGAPDLAEASGLPVLGTLPGDSGELLLANARFAAGEEVPHSILVVPVGEEAPAKVVCERIEKAAGAESPAEAEARGGSVHVYACAPLSREIATAYTARAADAVLLTAAQWDDSRIDVESAARELKLANANVVGSVLVNMAKVGKERKEPV